MLPIEHIEEEEVEIAPLSAKENKRRAELESVVERHFKAVLEFGAALKELRVSKLYRSTHSRWSDYCKDLWDITKTHADRFINASCVIENLTPIGVILPKNEAQARPLTLIEDPEKQQEIWQSIVANAPEGRITAALVDRVVRGVLGQERGERREGAQRRIAREEQMEMGVKRFFKDFFGVVDEAKHDKWQKTSKESLIKHLNELIRIVTEA